MTFLQTRQKCQKCTALSWAARMDGSWSGDRQSKEPEDVLIPDKEMRDINDGENAVDLSGHWARST